MVTWGSASEDSPSKVSRGGGNRYGKSKKKGSHAKKSLVRMVDDEKKALLAEKHAELEEVWNKHDMLVRISFFRLFPSHTVTFFLIFFGYVGQGNVPHGELYVDDIVRSNSRIFAFSNGSLTYEPHRTQNRTSERFSEMYVLLLSRY